MHQLSLSLFLGAPTFAAIMQQTVPTTGHEGPVYWMNWGAFAVMAWAFYGLLKAERDRAAKDRGESEERLERLTAKWEATAISLQKTVEADIEQSAKTSAAVERLIEERACPYDNRGGAHPTAHPRKFERG